MTVWAARLSVIACGVHAVLFLGLHALEPDISPISGIISDYAEAGQTTVTTAAFVAFAISWASVAVALAEPPGSRTLVVGRTLFVLAALAILVAAALPETADPRTGGGLARVQNLLARPGLFAGVLLTSLALRSAPGWDRSGQALVGLATCSVVSLVLTVAVLLTSGYGGVGQRLIFLMLYVWIWLVARGVRTHARATA